MNAVQKMIYLDHNATTRPAPEVVGAMNAVLDEHWANASSIHRPGQAVRHLVDEGRERVAALLGCRDRDVVFTSGGTEADNLALLGTFELEPHRNVVVTEPAEHSAIRDSVARLEERGREVAWLAINQDGLVDLEHLRELLERRADEIAVVLGAELLTFRRALNLLTVLINAGDEGHLLQAKALEPRGGVATGA